MDNFSRRAAELKRRRDNINTDFSQPWSTPSFDKGDMYDPKNLLFNEHRRQMFYAYELGAAPVLAQYLYDYAASKYLPNDSMWKYFAEDKQSQEPILPFLLSTIHPDVVRALICGNLTHRYHTEPLFRNSVHRTTNPQSVVGIYMLQWYHKGLDPDADTQVGTVLSSAQSRYFGKGLSLQDWIDLKNDLRLYLSTGGNDLAKRLDKMFIPQDNAGRDAANDPDGRVYAQNPHQRKVIEQFCVMVEQALENIAQNASLSVRTEPADFSPVLVGYGANCASRARDHSTNNGTGALFGLVNCIMRYRHKGRYGLQTYQLLYICDESHRNLAEAACSVLASSYHDVFGLNGKRGGAIGLSPDHAAYTYRQNIESLFNFGPPSPGGTRRQFEGSEARGFLRGQEHVKKCRRQLEKYYDPQKPPMPKLTKAIQKTVDEIDYALDLITRKSRDMDIGVAMEKLLKEMEKAERESEKDVAQRAEE